MKLTVLVAYTLLFITGASATDETTKLTLLHINDHHSHLTESSAGYINIPGGFIPSAVSENNGNTALIRAYYGGMPRLVTAFNALQEQAEANGRDVLKVHAGDAITGTPYFTLFKGNADAKIMSHICLDAFTPGNHEFDNGDAGLAKFLESMKDAAKTSPCNKMPAILGANIQPHNESPILADGIPEIEKSRVYTLTNGEKVGIVGIDIARKTMESSQPDEGTLILDEKDSAQAEINKLIASGVNKIVLLTHIGYQYDQDWMAQLDGVDVVIGGDSHTLLGNDVTAFFGPARGPYATKITKDDGSIVCVVHAWEYSKAIGQLEVDFDDDGNVISCGGQTIFPLNPSKVTVYDASPPYDMSEEDATLVAAFLMGLSNQQARPYEEDEAAATDLALFTKDINGLAQTVVATSSELIPLETRQHESGTCDLVVQGFLLNPLSSADVAIQNQGGCRQSIEQGGFSVYDAYGLLPYANTIVNLEMTGEQIKNVLEDAMNFFLDPNGAQGAYPRASGLRFDINEAKPFGSRVSNLEINPKLEGSWSKIDMSATYTVIANNFIAGGKDGYFEFKKVPDDKKVDTFVEYAQSFIDYAKSVNTLTSVSDDRASTQEWSDSLRPSVGADESGCATKNMKITLFSALVIFVSIWA